MVRDQIGKVRQQMPHKGPALCSLIQPPAPTRHKTNCFVKPTVSDVVHICFTSICNPLDTPHLRKERHFLAKDKKKGKQKAVNPTTQKQTFEGHWRCNLPPKEPFFLITKEKTCIHQFGLAKHAPQIRNVEDRKGTWIAR